MRTIEVFNSHPTLRFSKKAVQTLFRALDTLPDYAPPKGTISTAFLPDHALSKLHQRFLNDPSPTDVITFQSDPETDPRNTMAGEICVSVDCAITAAKQHSLPFAHELTLYLLHGWLHLTGLSDLTPTAYTVMKTHEARLMSWISEHHLFPNFTLKS
jgi:probable rRNA maturation factor